MYVDLGDRTLNIDLNSGYAYVQVRSVLPLDSYYSTEMVQYGSGFEKRLDKAVKVEMEKFDKFFRLLDERKTAVQNVVAKAVRLYCKTQKRAA